VSSSNASYTHFRLSEKYFKNRAVKGRLPNLHDQSIIDLSRPSLQDEDEVWQAGWWDPEQAAKNGSRKGKERDQGERPEMSQKGLRRVELLDGREAWVVAEGNSGGLRELSPSS